MCATINEIVEFIECWKERRTNVGGKGDNGVAHILHVWYHVLRSNNLFFFFFTVDAAAGIHGAKIAGKSDENGVQQDGRRDEQWQDLHNAEILRLSHDDFNRCC